MTGTSRPALPPTFAPASGWYRPGTCSPGSSGERQEMRAAALPGTVVVLRRRGERIPTEQLLRRAQEGGSPE